MGIAVGELGVGVQEKVLLSLPAACAESLTQEALYSRAPGAGQPFVS